MTNWRAQVGGRGRPPHTGITQAFAPPPKALPADPAQSDSSYLQHRRRRTPGHRSSRNKSRIYPRVHGHGVAQHVHVAVFLRETFGERLPLVAASATAINAQLAFMHEVLRVALD